MDLYGVNLSDFKSRPGDLSVSFDLMVNLITSSHTEDVERGAYKE